ncbi:MAG: alpha/beta hydrolase [Polyangiales bacterium]
MAHSIAPTALRLKRRIELFLARLILAFFDLVEKLRPLPAPPGTISLHRYGPDGAETIQCIARKPGSPERAPVVFIHGGGWIIGKKELYTRELLFLAEAGHPVFNVEYPTAPENPHPGILLSLLDALRWIRREHPGVDAVHLMGDSAGGNLAMMLGIFSANPHLLQHLDDRSDADPPVRCCSVVSLYGVLDRLSWLERGFPGADLMLECYAGKAAFEEKVSPALSITPMDLEFDAHPPSFLVAGSTDRLSESTRIFAKRLEAGTGVVSVKIYEGEPHGFFNMSWRPASSVLKADVLAFLEAHDR